MKFTARFYSDENLPVTLIKALREFNHDVLTSYEAGNANQGISDEEVLIYATSNNRIVVTFNRDDFIELHCRGINYSGIVVCKSDRNYQGQAQIIHEYFGSMKDNFNNQLIRILKQNQPKSAQQIFVIREYTN